MTTLFKPRLLACMKRGDMVPADCRHWFERNHATVRYWIYGAKNDYDPMMRGPIGRITWRNLKLLEWAIEKGIGFPIPANLSALERPRYLRKWHDALDARVSESNLTK